MSSAERRLRRQEYIACVLADADGDKISPSTFDTRDLDKSQPDLSCGTHIITGGTGKYAGSEPFACNSMPALARGRGLYRDGHPPQHVLGDQEIEFLP